MDYRDLVIRDLADGDANLREANKQLVALVESLQADAAVYRELAQAAFDAVRDVTVRYDRLHATHAETVHAYRCLRETLLLQSTPDDECVPV